MNRFPGMIGLAAMALALLSARAQNDSGVTETQFEQPETPPPADASSVPAYGGLLSKTYLGIDALVERFRQDPGAPTAFGAAARGNFPVTDSLDYGLNADFEHGLSNLFKLTETDLSNDLTAYYKFKYVSPYALAGFGYSWEHTTQGGGVPDRFDHLFGDLAAGLEFPLSQEAALRAALADDQTVRRPRERDWDYDFSANYWLGSSLGTYVGAVVKEGHNGALDAVEYTAGVRIAFD